MGVIGTPANTIDATVNFTTNSQTVTNTNNSQVFNGTISVSDGITVSVNGTVSPVINGVLNGLGSSAILKMSAGTLTYNNGIAPMLTGKLYCN